MNKTAIFPGSFDPFTIGHQSIVSKALPLFEKIIISTGINTEKKALYTIQQRIDWIKEIYIDNPKIDVQSYTGLTIDFCKKKKANFIIRGVRNIEDFKFESNIAQMNNKLHKEVETIFFISDPENTHISSTIIRDIIKNNGDVSQFLPKEIKL